MLIGGISPYSKVVTLRVVNSFEILWCLKLFFFPNFFAIYFAIKVAIKWWNYFTMQKVVNFTVPKNNLFHQVYSFATLEVAFSHLFGLTERRGRRLGFNSMSCALASEIGCLLFLEDRGRSKGWRCGADKRWFTSTYHFYDKT